MLIPLPVGTDFANDMAIVQKCVFMKTTCFYSSGKACLLLVWYHCIKG